MKAILITAVDARLGRGDAVHFLALTAALSKLMLTRSVHRGTFPLLSGYVESAAELRGLGNLFRTVTYHMVLAIWIVKHADSRTVIYGRDWSVGLIAWFASRLRRARCVYEVNSLVFAEKQFRPNQVATRLADIVQRQVILRVDAVTVVTDRLRETILRELGSDPKRIWVVPNATDVDIEIVNCEVARRRLGLSPEGRLVGFVGNFAPWQGLPLLIRAFKIVADRSPETTLVLVGWGPEGPRTKALAEELRLTHRILFPGQVDHESAIWWISALDVAVLPFEKSLRDDLVGRSPLKAYEYMACAKPLVSGEFPGLSAEITEAACGIVVPPDDNHALAAAILQLLENPEEASSMGIAGRGWVMKKRTWELVARRVHDVCVAVSEGSRRGRRLAPVRNPPRK